MCEDGGVVVPGDALVGEIKRVEEAKEVSAETRAGEGTLGRALQPGNTRKDTGASGGPGCTRCRDRAWPGGDAPPRAQRVGVASPDSPRLPPPAGVPQLQGSRLTQARGTLDFFLCLLAEISCDLDMSTRGASGAVRGLGKLPGARVWGPLVSPCAVTSICSVGLGRGARAGPSTGCPGEHRLLHGARWKELEEPPLPFPSGDHAVQHVGPAASPEHSNGCTWPTGPELRLCICSGSPLTPPSVA